MEPKSESSSHVDHQQELGADVVVPRGPESPPVTAKVRVPVSEGGPSETEHDRSASTRQARARWIAGAGAALFATGVIVALVLPQYGALAYGAGGVALCAAAAVAVFVWLRGGGRSGGRPTRAPGR